MRLHLSGPITGRPNDNAEAFDALERLLSRAGHTCFHPPREQPGSVPWGKAMIANLTWIEERAQGQVALHDWQASPGARIEHAFADRLGLPIWLSDPAGRILPDNDAAFEWELRNGRLHDRLEPEDC